MNRRARRAHAVNIGALRALLAALALTLLAACYPELDWREFRSDEGRFVVLLPDKPSLQSGTIALAGETATMHMHVVQKEDAVFGVGYADLPPTLSSDRAIAAARDALVANIGGKLSRDDALKLNGSPGRDIRAEGRVRDRDYLLAARLYVVGTRLYQIDFIGSRKVAERADLDLFLGSFKLVMP